MAFSASARLRARTIFTGQCQRLWGGSSALTFCSGEQIQESPPGHDGNGLEMAELKKVIIPGHDAIGLPFQGAGQDHVIRWVFIDDLHGGFAGDNQGMVADQPDEVADVPGADAVSVPDFGIVSTRAISSMMAGQVTNWKRPACQAVRICD